MITHEDVTSVKRCKSRFTWQTKTLLSDLICMDVLICLPFELSCWSSLTKGGLAAAYTPQKGNGQLVANAADTLSDFEASIYNVDQSECRHGMEKPQKTLV